jgi:hypothetical protein
VAFIVETRRKQPHHMHSRLARISGKLLYQWVALHLLGHIVKKLRDPYADSGFAFGVLIPRGPQMHCEDGKIL